MWKRPTPEQAQRGILAVLVSRTTDAIEGTTRITRYNETPYRERSLKRRVMYHFRNRERGLNYAPDLPDFLDTHALAIEWGILPELIDNAA